MAIWSPATRSSSRQHAGSRAGKDGREKLKDGEVTADKTHSNGFPGRRTVLDRPPAKVKCLEPYPVRRGLLRLLHLKPW